MRHHFRRFFLVRTLNSIHLLDFVRCLSLRLILNSGLYLRYRSRLGLLIILNWLSFNFFLFGLRIFIQFVWQICGHRNHTVFHSIGSYAVSYSLNLIIELPHFLQVADLIFACFVRKISLVFKALPLLANFLHYLERTHVWI